MLLLNMLVHMVLLVSAIVTLSTVPHPLPFQIANLIHLACYQVQGG